MALLQRIFTPIGTAKQTIKSIKPTLLVLEHSARRGEGAAPRGAVRRPKRCIVCSVIWMICTTAGDLCCAAGAASPRGQTLENSSQQPHLYSNVTFPVPVEIVEVSSLSYYDVIIFIVLHFVTSMS